MTSDGESQFYCVEEWKSVPTNPDLAEDFGYELHEIDVIETNNGSGQVLLLPNDESAIREESFIVAQADALVDLVDSR